MTFIKHLSSNLPPHLEGGLWDTEENESALPLKVQKPRQIKTK